MFRRSRIALALSAVVGVAWLSACGRPQGAELAERAYRQRLSGVPITLPGRVTRLLADDTQPPAHQRFIIETARGQTLLVLYNLDFGPRVPVRVGDRVVLCGEYLWNRQGGAIHKLHGDPRGRAPAGWVRIERTGRSYP
jgi:hypothetical protein